MAITIEERHARYFGLAILILLVLGIVFHSGYTPYLNNQWKPNRWTSDICRKQDKDPVMCTLPLKVQGSTETGYFDVDMEHGHLRRIK